MKKNNLRCYFFSVLYSMLCVFKGWSGVRFYYINIERFLLVRAAVQADVAARPLGHQWFRRTSLQCRKVIIIFRNLAYSEKQIYWLVHVIYTEHSELRSSEKSIITLMMLTVTELKTTHFYATFIIKSLLRTVYIWFDFN